MDGRYFVGLMEITPTALSSFNGGLHWFKTLADAKKAYENPPQAAGAHNIIILGERIENLGVGIVVIECKPVSR